MTQANSDILISQYATQREPLSCSTLAAAAAAVAVELWLNSAGLAADVLRQISLL